jgi:Icc-related predicted phosphoesterase
MKVRIVAISDTHGQHRKLWIPPGDILVHAGDITWNGDPAEVKDFNAYLGRLPHRHKVVIAGNHDFCFENDPDTTRALLTNCIYLQDESVVLEGLRFYGSPWQPWFYDWAFNLPRGAALKAKWDLIPPDTNVLITHGPPAGYGDLTSFNDHAGCSDLLDTVKRIRPRVHIFGHIHEGAGVIREADTTYINASTCDALYQLANKPIVYDYEIREPSQLR